MKAIILLISTAIFLVACVYEDNDTYVNPVVPPDGAGAAINLNDATGLIDLNKPTMFSFTVHPTGKGNYEAQITAGNYRKELYPSSTGLFYFTIDPALVGEGVKKLKIEVVYPSLSPSLAGQLGAELMILTQEWNLSVNTTPPAPIPAPMVYIEDGKSMIEWNSPSNDTFLELIILRRYLDDSGNQIHRDSIKIQDRNATVFHDASYLGGKVSYRIDLKGYKYYVQGAETIFSVQPLQFSLDSLAAAPIVSWKRSPLYNNDITIQFGSDYSINTAGARIMNDIAFGFTSSQLLTLQANHPPFSNTHSAYRKEMNVPYYRGVKIDPFYSMAYAAEENAYLMLDQNQKLNKIDATTLQKVASIDWTAGGTLITSPDGKLVYIQTENDIYKINPVQLSNLGKIDLTSLTGNSMHSIVGKVSLSNSNVIAFSMNYWSNPKDFAIDLTAGEVIWQRSAATLPVISPDGNYIFAYDRILKKEGSAWNELPGLLPSSEFIPTAAFYNDGSINRLYFVHWPRKVYDVEAAPDGVGNRVPIETIPYNLAWIDYTTNSFCGIDMPVSYLGTAYIHDLKNNSSIIRSQQIREPEDAYFLNGHFFHQSGMYLP
jgi:hypothetical protein